jgi:hypothetical protein
VVFLIQSALPRFSLGEPSLRPPPRPCAPESVGCDYSKQEWRESSPSSTKTSRIASSTAEDDGSLLMRFYQRMHSVTQAQYPETHCHATAANRKTSPQVTPACLSVSECQRGASCHRCRKEPIASSEIYIGCSRSLLPCPGDTNLQRAASPHNLSRETSRSSTCSGKRVSFCADSLVSLEMIVKRRCIKEIGSNGGGSSSSSKKRGGIIISSSSSSSRRSENMELLRTSSSLSSSSTPVRAGGGGSGGDSTGVAPSTAHSSPILRHSVTPSGSNLPGWDGVWIGLKPLR